MSMQCFLAVETALQNTEYNYKDILPSISVSDMYYNDKVCFDVNLTSAEKDALGNIFNDFYVYAIRSGFKFNYEPRYRQVLSEKSAKNALDELKWLKEFAKKKLLQQDVFMLINLRLGKETDFNRIKTNYFDVNEWELNENESFEFDYGIIYQFVDNSKEAIELRRKRNNF